MKRLRVRKVNLDRVNVQLTPAVCVSSIIYSGGIIYYNIHDLGRFLRFSVLNFCIIFKKKFLKTVNKIKVFLFYECDIYIFLIPGFGCWQEKGKL